jgi:hypothetical protein
MPENIAIFFSTKQDRSQSIHGERGRVLRSVAVDEVCRGLFGLCLRLIRERHSRSGQTSVRLGRLGVQGTQQAGMAQV